MQARTPMLGPEQTAEPMAAGPISCASAPSAEELSARRGAVLQEVSGDQVVLQLQAWRMVIRPARELGCCASAARFTGDTSDGDHRAKGLSS